MIRRSEYLPLSELDGYDDERVTWRVALPQYAPAENIGINISRLGSFARLGGFENIRISNYSGETTSVVPQIGSVDAKGNATASMRAAVAKADLQQASAGPDDGESMPAEYKWARGNININSAELDNRVGEKNGLRDPQIWAKTLNSALAQGIRSASRVNLLEKPSTYQKLRTPIIVGVFAGLDAGLFGDSGNKLYRDVLLGYAQYDLFLDPMLCRFLDKLHNRRFSFILGLNLDRQLALEGLSRALPIARSLSQPSNT